MTKKGFTLIELLIVIAVLGILAGIVLAVINPTRQNERARQGVIRANLAKVCQAMVACISSQTSYNNANCNSWDKVGAMQPTTPSGVTYNFDINQGTGDWNHIGSYVDYSPSSGWCRMRCVVYNNLADWAGYRAGIVVVNADGAAGCTLSQ